MAHIAEETVTLTFSQISKDGQTADTAITPELIETLITVAQELVAKGVVVEAK